MLICVLSLSHHYFVICGEQKHIVGLRFYYVKELHLSEGKVRKVFYLEEVQRHLIVRNSEVNVKDYLLLNFI
jgi:hypothetical protein